MRSYTDGELARAVAGSHSWRGVLRHLGLPPQSSGALRAARARAVASGIGFDHFTGQRRWSDVEFREAVGSSHEWDEVLDRLGLSRTSGSARASLKAHAARLGVAVDHLDTSHAASREEVPGGPVEPGRLPSAGPLLAAAWFTLRGYDVAWPLEPARYDLLVTAAGRTLRVQVKTTRTRSAGSWVVRISSNRPNGTVVYTPEEIDHFFVVDGDLGCYLIPLNVVGGRQVLYLRRYAAFALPRWLAAG